MKRKKCIEFDEVYYLLLTVKLKRFLIVDYDMVKDNKALWE